jgi:hypothetical protein
LKTMRRIIAVLVLAAASNAHGEVPAAAAAMAATQQRPPPERGVEPAAMDRLQLDSTSITGNRELPKVMSIVPWKASEPPSGPDRPMGSLIEEIISPLDPAEFRREITYFRDLTSQSTDADHASHPSTGSSDARSANQISSPGASIP